TSNCWLFGRWDYRVAIQGSQTRSRGQYHLGERMGSVAVEFYPTANAYVLTLFRKERPLEIQPNQILTLLHQYYCQHHPWVFADYTVLFRQNQQAPERRRANP